MARIEGIRIQNYRALHDVTFGRVLEAGEGEALPSLVAIIGPNGSGKSTVLDALAFIGDCLSLGVEEACDQPHRGGFERLRSKGQDGPIAFEITYRDTPTARPTSYTLQIDIDRHSKVRVAREMLRFARPGMERRKLFTFLELANGKGSAWAGQGTKDRREVAINDVRRLGIASLGNLSEHPRVVAFRKFLESWYLSYFVPEVARALPMAGAQKHLDRAGANLANYVQYMEREHSQRFKRVLKEIARKIPGVEKITHTRASDGRLLIQFNDRGFEDPFYAQDMSDGTLKMFTYLLLLEDPAPARLIGIEEPENGLHHQLLAQLAHFMKEVSRREKGPQIFVTTHSPHFIDGLRPEEVFVVAKGDDGFTRASRAADSRGVTGMVKEGIPLGSLWYSNHLGQGNP